MKPSSSTSDRLLARLFGETEVDRDLSDEAWVRHMLEVEAALALAGADAGVVPPECAQDIAHTCERLVPDLDDLAVRAQASGNPVVPLVDTLSAAVPERARPWVHYGATSQDIIDTSLALMARAAGMATVGHLRLATSACAELATRHRHTLMIARTLGQQAVPTTFGLKTAGWLVALDEARERLNIAVSQRLAVQLGGAAGTLAAFDGKGSDVVAAFGRRLQLGAPVLPWHTNRQRLVDLAAGFGGAVGAAGKIARDVQLMSQTEVGELSEGGKGRGGSSAMPHKHNPVHSVLVTAAALRVPGLVATLFAALPQEHERAAGAWHAEWPVLRELVAISAGAAAHTACLLRDLEVHPERMRENLDASGGLVMAEAVARRLAMTMGRPAAHEVISDCIRQATRHGVGLRAVLATDPRVRAHLDEAAIDDALDPSAAVVAAAALIDRVLALRCSIT